MLASGPNKVVSQILIQCCLLLKFDATAFADMLSVQILDCSIVCSTEKQSRASEKNSRMKDRSKEGVIKKQSHCWRCVIHQRPVDRVTTEC